jgi:hypothetical protein
MTNLKKIKDVFDKKKGFCYSKLDTGDYKIIFNLINDHFEKLVKKFNKDNKKKINLKNYHKYFKFINHEKIFTKRNRLLSKKDIDEILIKTRLISKLKSIFGEIFITDEENIGYPNIYWRCVRPKPYIDVGPFHKDKWFWDLGCGIIDKKFKRVKVWISLMSENKKLGFRFIKGSVGKSFKYKSEFRHNQKKPIFEESQLQNSKIESAKGQKGSLIVFNDELLHSGEVITGDKCRVSLEFTFCFNKYKPLTI